uniref:hypothetical protein n=1 Tax=Acidisphaera sp. L21 TaxID=1641851 RepID=UPI001C2051BA
LFHLRIAFSHGLQDLCAEAPELFDARLEREASASKARAPSMAWLSRNQPLRIADVGWSHLQPTRHNYSVEILGDWIYVCGEWKTQIIP